MRTKTRRFAIVAVSALAAGGTGAAIAATGDDRAREAEDAILSDAAARLDVEASELRSALLEAKLAQVDKAVEDGVLSEEAGEAIKERMQESGFVLGFPGGLGGPHELHLAPAPAFGGPAVFDAIAAELGISVEQLHRQVLGGKSIRQVAEANGRTVADVKDAAKAALAEQIADDVDAGRISEDEADRLRADLPAILERLVRGPRFHRRDRAMPLPPPPGLGAPPPPRLFFP